MTPRITLLAALCLPLCAAGPALGQFGRDYQREANAAGMNLAEYINKVRGQERRKAYTHGGERPGAKDYPEYWENGYKAGLDGLDTGDLSKRDASYRHGYEAGRRQAAQNAAQRLPLLGRYGSEEAVNAWDDGFRDGRDGGEMKPPAVEQPNAYLAYVEGHLAGRSAQASGGGTDPTAALKPRGGDAIRYVKEYVKHLNAVTQHSDRYYLLLDKLNQGFRLTEESNVRLGDSIARTKLAMETVKELIKLHSLINDHAYFASRVQPLVIASMEAQASERLALMASMELDIDRDNLLKKANQLTAEARRLEAEPVLLPGNFPERGRRQQQLLKVLAASLESDQVREALGSGELDPGGVGSKRPFGVFDESWRRGQSKEYEAWESEFNEWLKTRLPHSYPSK
jgi:hypothetical protein